MPNDLSIIIDHYLEITGQESTNYERHLRAAKYLLELCDGKTEKAKEMLDRTKAWVEGFGGEDWTIDTAVKKYPEFRQEQIRTKQQNRSLHLFYKKLAKAFNDAGLDMRKVLSPAIAIPWTEKTIKDLLWRPLQKAYLGKESTTELNTKDIDRIYDVLNREVMAPRGVRVAFPSVEEMLYEEGVYDHENFKNRNR